MNITVRILHIIIFLLISFNGYSQQNFERRTYIELKGRANFYHVNDRYQLLSDTMFFSNEGFFVKYEYDINKKNDVEYLILTYPNFNKKNNKQHVEKVLSDTITIGDVRQNGVRASIKGKNDRTLMIEKVIFDSIEKTELYSTKWNNIKNYRITTGILTIPFKFRPVQDTINFNITTDVTLGPYIGITKRLSSRNPFYVTVPATLGLTFVNINDNTTSSDIITNNINIIPGISWSSGLVFTFDKFNLGLVVGKDYASGIGDSWLYQRKFWYSFAIGYSFLNDQK